VPRCEFVRLNGSRHCATWAFLRRWGAVDFPAAPFLDPRATEWISRIWSMWSHSRDSGHCVSCDHKPFAINRYAVKPLGVTSSCRDSFGESRTAALPFRSWWSIYESPGTDR
jgi:hypothetical protein